jgi:hypothetical protein
MCFENRPQTPFACNHATYLSSCVSEADPRPQLLAKNKFLVNLCFWSRPQTPVASNHAAYLSTCVSEIDPRPHMIAIMLHFCQLVFLKKTPDPNCFQSCYIFVNMSFRNRPQTPFACDHATYLSTCVSEEDPRPHLLAIMLHICQLPTKVKNSKPQGSIINSLYDNEPGSIMNV